MNKFLFIFAHPDDETVGCGGTILQLCQAGYQVQVISVTDGGAGEVMPRAQAKLKQYPNVGKLRQAEFKAACQHLGASAKILDFEDGGISNTEVWGGLLSTLIEEIEQYQPDVVITFDHSGWYFHLDHVGVSIATTLAVQKVTPQPALFFHAHFRPDSSKWHYVFADVLPISHRVDVTQNIEMKLAALDLHDSQDLGTPRTYIKNHQKHYETYQLVYADKKGKNWLNEQQIFISNE